MPNIFDDGSGNVSPSATLASADSTLNGYAFLLGSGMVGPKVISFDYAFAGTSKFRAEVRHHNGVAWMKWHALTDDEGVKTFDSAKGNTGVCEFSLYNQRFYRPKARGIQFRIVRTSGSGDITFTNGVMD